MRFYALDVETANPDMASICQVGVGIFDDGHMVGGWKAYIDPGDWFHPRFIDIHGITPAMVKGKRSFPKVYPKIRKMFENSIVVHHSPFDRVAFQKVFARYGLEPFEVMWLDSVKVARRAFGKGTLEGGYGLASLARHLDIEFRHHDALEDAVACGKVVAHACRRHGVGIGHWFGEGKQPAVKG